MFDVSNGNGRCRHLQAHLLIPLPYLPQIIFSQFWVNAFSPVGSNERDLHTHTQDTGCLQQGSSVSLEVRVRVRMRVRVRLCDR